MTTTERPNPDALLAHVRVLRLTDKLLGVAEQLREARDDLDKALRDQHGQKHAEQQGAAGVE
jgi:hypothetical protein